MPEEAHVPQATEHTDSSPARVLERCNLLKGRGELISDTAQIGLHLFEGDRVPLLPRAAAPALSGGSAALVLVLLFIFTVLLLSGKASAASPLRFFDFVFSGTAGSSSDTSAAEISAATGFWDIFFAPVAALMSLLVYVPPVSEPPDTHFRVISTAGEQWNRLTGRCFLQGTRKPVVGGSAG